MSIRFNLLETSSAINSISDAAQPNVIRVRYLMGTSLSWKRTTRESTIRMNLLRRKNTTSKKKRKKVKVKTESTTNKRKASKLSSMSSKKRMKLDHLTKMLKCESMGTIEEPEVIYD